MLNKVILYIIAAVVVTGLIVGGYYAWKGAIEAAANTKLMIGQLEQATKDLRDTNDQLKAITKASEQTRLELDRQVEAIRQQSDDLDASISKLEDRDSSDVLKKTIEGLVR